MSKVFMSIINSTLQTQDLFPYDSFTLGINNQYIPLPDKRFLVNCKKVLASNSIITLCKHYILVMPLNQELSVQVVELDDVFFDGALVHLILYCQKNNEMIFLKARLIEDDSDSIQNWWLIDSHITIQIFEKLKVWDYCLS